MPESILDNKRILAVDDEPDVLETLEEQLEEFDGLIFDKATDYDTGYLTKICLFLHSTGISKDCFGVLLQNHHIQIANRINKLYVLLSIEY